MYRKLAAFAIATGLVLAAFTTTIVEESSRANAIPLPAEEVAPAPAPAAGAPAAPARRRGISYTATFEVMQP